MRIISIIGILALGLTAQNVFGGECPPASHMGPCNCTNTTIECITEADFDLSQVFKAIAQGKDRDSEELAFETFILNSSMITKLEDNIFEGVTFDTIYLVGCHQLDCVAPSAFNKLGRNLTKFISVGTSFGSTEKGCSVFEALELLYNLEEIVLTNSKINEIPGNAFEGKMGPLKSLKKIDFSGDYALGGNLTKVGKRAFSTLKSLEYLDLSYNKINEIESFGFEFMDPIRDKLVIDLTHNKLTEKSFGIEAFEVNDRVTELRLNANHELLVLSEMVFSPFLVNRANETDNNVIDLSGTPLKCSADNVWLFERKTVLRLEDKLKNVLATDGDIFWRHTKSECAKHTY